jgi:hypothetical protein
MKQKLTAASVGQTTTAPVTAPAVTVLQRDPEFVRLPKTGTLCPYTGLARSKMNELVLACAVNDFKPPVHSVCLRRRGGKKGCRLISFKSLMEYLHAQEWEQNQTAESATP